MFERDGVSAERDFTFTALRRKGHGNDPEMDLKAVGAAVPVGHEIGSHSPTQFHADLRGQDRAEVEESHFRGRRALRFVSVAVATRARRSVEKCESAGTATIVAHAQK